MEGQAPKYQQLAQLLRGEIEAGKFRDGDVLGTEDALSAKYAVSRQTVRQAIAVLAQLGLVVTRQGSGTYVSLKQPGRAATRTIAVVASYITDYIFPSIVRGVENVLSARKFAMTLAATYNCVERERALLSHYLKNPVDGLIVEGTKTALPNPNVDLYAALAARGVPVVFINGCYPELPDAVSVTTDDRGGGRAATEYLLARGHKKIAGVFKVDDRQGHERYAGYLAALLAAGLGVRDEQVAWFTTENKARQFTEGTDALRALSECTALVAYNDEIAARAVEALREKRVRVPEDLSIVSFDNSSFAGLCYPPLTSLAHPRDALGALAAEKLLDLIAGRETASAVMPFVMTERESVKTLGGSNL